MIPWQDDSQPRYSWYEPLRDADAIARGVRYILSKPQLFLNTSSDATLLPTVLEAATTGGAEPSRSELEADVRRFGIESLFVPDGPQGI